MGGLDWLDTQRYLRRLGLRSAPSRDLRGLTRLMRAHLLAVPFENLDIAWGVGVAHEERAFFEKVVVRGRGGWCFELNGLFACLLEALGFEVRRVAARMASDGKVGRRADHLALVVRLGAERCLVDVGAGDRFRTPLPLSGAREDLNLGLRHRVVRLGREHEVQSKRGGAPWSVVYRFGLAPRRLAWFSAVSRHLQTSPRSHFVTDRLANLALPQGTLRYHEGVFTRLDGRGERQRRWRCSPAGEKAALRRWLRLAV